MWIFQYMPIGRNFTTELMLTPEQRFALFKKWREVLINNGQELTHSAYVFINIEVKDAVSGIKNVYISNDGVFDTELTHPYPYSAVSPFISNWLVVQPDLDGIKTVYVKFEDMAG
jgi:hypothetical protein